MIRNQTAKLPETGLNLIFSMIFCLFLYFAAEGQIIKTADVTEGNGSGITVNETYIFLDPFEKRGSIQVEDSCLVLLSDGPIKINYPLGKAVKTYLPAGTKYFVPKGVYEIENPTGSYIEYQLLLPYFCRE